MGIQPGKATNDPTAYFAFAKQSAKGTAGTTFYFTRHGDGTSMDVEKEIESVREGGDGQEVGFRYVRMIKNDGNLAALARVGLTARIFAACIGGDTVGSAAVPSLARHTTALTASLPYFTIDQRFSDEIERGIDVVFTGFELSGEAGKPWELTAKFIGGGSVFQRDIASTLTPARELGKPIYYPFGSYVLDGFASYAADLTKIKVSVDRNVDDGIQTTGLTRDDVIPLNLDVSVDATAKYTSRDFYQKVKYNGGSTILQDLATGSIDLTMLQNVYITGSQVGSGAVRVQMPLIEWQDATVNKLDPDGKTVYIDLVGMSVKGSTYPIITQVDTTDLTAY